MLYMKGIRQVTNGPHTQLAGRRSLYKAHSPTGKPAEANVSLTNVSKGMLMQTNTDATLQMFAFVITPHRSIQFT